MSPLETHTTTSVKTTTNLRTIQETAELLNRSVASLRWMIQRGTAPKSALIGGRRMFRETDIQKFINAAFEQESAA